MTAMELITAGFWLALGGILGWCTLWAGLGITAFTYGVIKGVFEQLWP